MLSPGWLETRGFSNAHTNPYSNTYACSNSNTCSHAYGLSYGYVHYKLALKHRMHAKAIQEEPISQKEFEEIKAERDKLVARFGTPFKKDYGWAASTLGKKQPTIADIEESVDLEHWRPYYGMASDNVHANAHGAYYRLVVQRFCIDG